MELGELTQDLREIGAEVVGVNLPRRGVLGNHNHVPADWNPPVESHPLAYEALDPVSNDRVSHFLGDRDAESTRELGVTTSSCKRQNVTSVELYPVRLNGHELGAPTKPHLLGDAACRHAYFLAAVTEIRLRPFARRRRRTSRPPRVFLRARKPCVRLRLLLCGWYVRFTAILRRLRSGIDTQSRTGCQGAADQVGSISPLSLRTPASFRRGSAIFGSSNAGGFVLQSENAICYLGQTFSCGQLVKWSCGRGSRSGCG
jgi:hypothetical protein